MAKELKTLKYMLGNLNESPVHFGKCWVATTGGTVFTNETTDINSTTTGDVPLGGAVNDAIYFGSANQFGGLSLAASTSTAGGAGVWEYWNGSSWASLTTLSPYNPTLITSTTNLAFTVPTDWETTQVNSEVDGPWYYVRLRVTTLRTTAGTVSQGSLGPFQRISNAFTVYIPETTGRTIEGCFLKVYFERPGANGSILNYMRVEGRWDAASYANLKTPFSTDNNFSGWSEKGCMIDYLDITSTAQTAWSSGTSHTYDLNLIAFARTSGVGANTNVMNKAWAEMIITYQAEDTNTTKANSVTFAIPSLSGSLTTSHQTLGTLAANMIEESGITVRDLYFNFMCNWEENGSADWDLYGQLNSETETLLSTNDAAGQSDWYMPIPWKRTDLSLSSAYDVKLRTTNVTGARAGHVATTVTVTYEYDDTTTTRRTHTEEIPYAMWSGNGVPNTVSPRQKTIDWYVGGANPTFKNMGCLSYWSQNADPGDMNIKLGTAGAINYSSAPADVSGPVCAMTTATSGNLTFGRGYNAVTLQAFVNGSLAASNNVGALSGIAYVTWTYDRSSTAWQTKGYTLLGNSPDYLSNSRIQNDATQMYIPDSSGAAQYLITNCGCDLTYTTADLASLLFVSALYDSGKAVSLPALLNFTDANTSCKIQYPTQTFTSFLASGNAYRVPSGLIIYNYHNFTFPVSGTISGSSGGTVTLRLYRASTNEILQEKTQLGNGAYSFDHYDIEEVYVCAVESDTLKGMSKIETAGSGFDINLAGGGGTESRKSFVWGS
jgi:hypothetical protein